MINQQIIGQCLCGAQSYRFHGKPAFMAHGQCATCRRGSGTGHASNIAIARELVNLAARPRATRLRPMADTPQHAPSALNPSALNAACIFIPMTPSLRH